MTANSVRLIQAPRFTLGGFHALDLPRGLFWYYISIIFADHATRFNRILPEKKMDPFGPGRSHPPGILLQNL